MRAMSMTNILKIKHETFDFDGAWSQAFGENPSSSGFWFVWGKEKNGKTWFSLLLAKYLATKAKVLYVSAEEGLGKEFCEAIRRAGLSERTKNILFVEYETISDIRKYISKRNAPTVVFIDNLTIYNGEMKSDDLKKLLSDFPDKLFVLVAHEDRSQPYGALAQLGRRLAKIILHVKGLKAEVSGRCKGGSLVVDDEAASLYYNDVRNDDEG